MRLIDISILVLSIVLFDGHYKQTVSFATVLLRQDVNNRRHESHHVETGNGRRRIRTLTFQSGGDAHEQDEMIAFRRGLERDVRRTFVCDTECPDPDTTWYIQKDRWSTEMCPDLDDCKVMFRSVVDEDRPMLVTAKKMAWFKEENVEAWKTHKKVIAYCGSTYKVTKMEDDFDRHYKVVIANTTMSRDACCGMRFAEYDRKDDC